MERELKVKFVASHIDMLKVAWERRDYDVLKMLIGALVHKFDLRVDGKCVDLYALPDAQVYELVGKLAPTGVEPVLPP